MAKTTDVIKNFLHGDTKGTASNLRIEGDKLIFFGTTIAQRINGVVHLNLTNYSQSTTRHQNVLKRELTEAPSTEGVPMGTHDLKRFF